MAARGNIGRRLYAVVMTVVIAIIAKVMISPSSTAIGQSFPFISPVDLLSHTRMIGWLKKHPFKFGFPKALNRFFIEKLVKDPSNFILPPGQLWPYPAEFWTIRPSWWFTIVWDWVVYFTSFTHYTSHLILYRLTNSGFGYLYDVNPGYYKINLAKMKEIEDAGKIHTAEWRLAAFYAATSLFHSAEDDRQLTELLEILCQETALTPKTCDDPSATDAWKSTIRNLLMSSYLRLGENDNCRENHSHESCLLPLKGKAVHMKPYGSEKALKYINIELQARPENIGAKWLLNVAHMTLGSYPNDVPKQYLMDPKLFESEYDIKTFPNVEELLGLETYTSMGTGIMDDFVGEDGLKDIFQCSQSYNRNVKMYKNLGNGKFQDITKEAGLWGIDGGANCRQADYNNDGHLDIFIMRGGWLLLKHVNSILRNNGDGTFTDVTFKSGFKSRGATHTMDFGDINRDGLLDMFVANEDVPCELWLNKGNDTFVNVANLPITNCGLVKGMVFTDYNDDMWPDIMLSKYSATNALLRNDGKFLDKEQTKWSFTDVTKEVGLGDPWFSFPTTSFDADQDGTLDILVAGHLFEGPDAVCWIYTNESYFVNTLHTPTNPGFGGTPDQKLTRLFLNKNGKFEEIGEKGGLRRHIMSMAMNYGDLDNDGYLDLYFGTGQPDIRALQPNRMYRNDLHASGKFQDVTTSGNFGHLQKGHGIAFADLDNDGDVDVYAQMGGAFFGDFFHDAVYLNPGHGNNYLKFKLRGTVTNRYALGSRVFIYSVDANNKERLHHHFVSTGGSYGSNALEGHIGLGKAVRVSRVVVWWQRTGEKQTFYDVPINSKISIVEGKNEFEVVNEPSYLIDPSQLGKKAHAHHDHSGHTHTASCHGHANHDDKQDLRSLYDDHTSHDHQSHEDHTVEYHAESTESEDNQQVALPDSSVVETNEETHAEHYESHNAEVTETQQQTEVIDSQPVRESEPIEQQQTESVEVPMDEPFVNVSTQEETATEEVYEQQAEEVGEQTVHEESPSEGEL